MSEKRSKKPECSKTQKQFDALVKLLRDTWAQAEKEPVYANWLIHEARGHNELAEAMVLYGMEATEAWEFVLKIHGLTKAQAMRRRLQETRAAFQEVKRK